MEKLLVAEGDVFVDLFFFVGEVKNTPAIDLENKQSEDKQEEEH